MQKTCDQCNTQFDGHGLAKRCSDACRKRSKSAHAEKPESKAYQAEYKKTSKYKTQQAEYRQRPEVKASESDRRQTSEYKAGKARYYQRPGVKAKAAERNQTPESKAVKHTYRRTPAGREAIARGHAQRRGAPENGTRKHFHIADQCVCCGSTHQLELEHMTPISKGGTNYIENLTTMCAECNRGVGGKHTLGPHAWPEFVRWFLDQRALTPGTKEIT